MIRSNNSLGNSVCPLNIISKWYETTFSNIVVLYTIDSLNYIPVKEWTFYSIRGI